MSIKVIKAGLQTTIQDFGRTGSRRYGVTTSGALDNYSLSLANWLVGKPADSACMEITLIGPSLEFTQDMAIGITGAEFEVTLNDAIISNNQTVLVKKGDCLSFGSLKRGARAYISISADFYIEPVLGSFSTNLLAGFGGFKGRALKNKDVINLDNVHSKPPIKTINKQLIPSYSSKIIVRVTRGVEFLQFDKSAQEALFSNSYEVRADSNRMGLRTFGKELNLAEETSMTTSAICTGTIQVPSDGHPIITLADGQTTGGYPKIAQVISADLNLLGQVKAGDVLSFYPVSIEKAKKLLQTKNDFYSSIKTR